MEQVLDLLRSAANAGDLEGMKRFGISAGQRFGVRVPEMRRIAKEIGTRHSLALDLWKTGIADAQIVASMIADPERLTPKQMDAWVDDFDSWDVCDQTCMNLFEKSPHARRKLEEWSGREEEFVRRAAFALIACLAWHDKNASDEEFLGCFSLIESASVDDRNYVRKAVSWALRNIGKRNRRLNAAAIQLAKKIQRPRSKPGRWIASDVLRELESDAVQSRLKKRG